VPETRDPPRPQNDLTHPTPSIALGRNLCSAGARNSGSLTGEPQTVNCHQFSSADGQREATIMSDRIDVLDAEPLRNSALRATCV
jgi:hypothetical protein